MGRRECNISSIFIGSNTRADVRPDSTSHAPCSDGTGYFCAFIKNLEIAYHILFHSDKGSDPWNRRLREWSRDLYPLTRFGNKPVSQRIAITSMVLAQIILTKCELWFSFVCNCNDGQGHQIQSILQQLPNLVGKQIVVIGTKPYKYGGINSMPRQMYGRVKK